MCQVSIVLPFRWQDYLQRYEFGVMLKEINLQQNAKVPTAAHACVFVFIDLLLHLQIDLLQHP